MPPQSCYEKQNIDIEHLPSRRSSSLTLSYFVGYIAFYLCRFVRRIKKS